MRRILLLLPLLFFICNVSGQGRQIWGKVIDEQGETMIGVTIRVDQSSVGTITNIDGVFELEVPEQAKELVVSYVGFRTANIPITAADHYEIMLKQDYTNLEEVVVTGYSSQKRLNLTGAIENVAVEDLDSRSITNAGLALQGKVSGVMVTQNSGQPGQDNAEIRIRGVSSIENNNDPLVIIDGMEGELEDVHPRNIESMTVLKDASSAAIYGNRASAGVIIITTKQGEGRLKFNFSSTTSLQEATALPEPVDGYTYARLLNEARLNSGYPNVPYDEQRLEALESGDDLRLQSLDLYGLYFSPAWMQNYYATVSGGEKNYNFAFSFGYLDQDGVLLGTNAEKITYRAQMNSKFADDRIRLGLSLGGYSNNEKELTSSTPTVMTSIATTSPVGFIYAVDSITGEQGMYGGKARYLAMEDAGGGINRDRNNFSFTLKGEADLLTGLTAKVLFGQKLYSYQYTRLVPSVALAGNPYEDEVSSITQSSLQKIINNTLSSTFTSTLNYSVQFSGHDIQMLGGYEFLSYNYQEDNIEIKDLLANSPSFSFGDPETRFLSSALRERATMSYFGRINYAYNDKYLLEANIRRDGSSRFSSENRWGTFPSISAGWRISEEEFMQRLDFIYLKMRASWGRLGNERINVYYPSYDMLETGQYYSFGGKVYQGTATTLLANRDISWEVTEQVNIGLDATLFRNYSLSLNLFDKLTTDILGRIDVPLSLGLGTSGTSKPYQNIGKMRNSGIEAALDYNNRFNEWVVNGNINITYLKNEIQDLGGLDFVSHGVVSGYQPPANIIRSQVSYPFGSYFGLLFDRIYQVEDFTWQNESDPEIPHHERFYKLKPEHADPSAIYRQPVPGDLKFKDISGPDGEEDNLITNDDITFMGSSQPRMIYAINLGGRYKNIYFNILAQGTYGVEAYIMGAMVTPFWGGRGNISSEIADNRWTPETPSLTYQHVYDDSQRANVVSTYYIQDASYLRIKNIELGYTFKKSILEKAGIDEIRINLSIENAFTITSLKGFDPEKSFNKITGDFHPQVRMYSLGINIKI